MKSLVFSQMKLGSSFLLRAHGSDEARTTINNLAPQKNRAKSEKQKSKKEGGLEEGIFALLRFEIERFRNSSIRKKAKQKIFFSLIEKNLAARD